MIGWAAEKVAGTMLRRTALIGLAAMLVLLAGALGWAMRVDHLRAGWKADYEALSAQSVVVVEALGQAANNPDLTWEGAAGQALALGESNRILRVSIDNQNRAIDDMAQEAVRLRAQADELQRIAERARAQRAAALAKLSDMAITPGTRSDCMVLLREAEAALDLVYEAGL